MKKKINPDIAHVVDVLESKLTKDEFFALYVLMDSDPPAGPFYCAIADQAVKLCPEEFSNSNEVCKVEK